MADIESGEKEHHQKSPVPFLTFDIGHFPRSKQFFLLSGAVFVFYVLYGLTMEKIFMQPGLKKEGLYLTFVQFVFYSCMAKWEMVQKKERRCIPLTTYALLGGATVVTMGLSNASLGYLNYPTQVVFKSCKLIPVLIGGILLQKKRFSGLDFAAAVLMCLGLCVFTLADSKVSPNFNPTGIAMLSLALVADAVVSNVQEKAMKTHKAFNAEVILFSYGLGTIYLFVGLLLSGNLVSGVESFGANPVENYGLAFIFALTGYLGMQVVLSLVRTFGAFVAVTVTSMRKFLSVVISFVIFSKPFSVQYLLGGLIVVLGIYLNVASKSHVDLKLMCRKVLSNLFFFKRSGRLAASHV